MSAAEQFKTGVSECSGPKDWRVGLERSSRKQAAEGAVCRASGAREETRASKPSGN